MKSFGANLAAHYTGRDLTLARLIKVARTDGQVFGFTDHDQPIDGSLIGGVHAGIVYEADSGFSSDAIRSVLGMDVDNLRIVGGVDSEVITYEDVRAGKWDYAQVEHFEVNWKAPADGANTLFSGFLGKVSLADLEMSAEQDGKSKRLQQPTGRILIAPCDAKLGDARCTVNLASFTVGGAIDSVASRSQFTDAARTEADNWFRKGKITFTSGANSGMTYDVKASTAAGVITLQVPAGYEIAPGDTYTMVAGCDHTLEGANGCAVKFANVPNYRGFPHVPGLKWLASGTA